MGVEWNWEAETTLPEAARRRCATLAAALRVHPLVMEIVFRRLRPRHARDVAAFFRPGWEHLHDPMLLPGMEEAVRMLLPLVQGGGHIAVYGDYDPDGTAGTALLVEGLRGLGARVSWYVPSRTAEGYGLSPAGLQACLRGAQQAQGDLPAAVVAVDTGTNAREAAGWLRARSIPLIAVDHHLPRDVAEDALIVNPRLPGSAYPYPDLSGTGVAFQLLRALTPAAGREELPFLRPLLDLVAVANLADHVPLTGENRVLTHLGIAVLNERRRPGLAALVRQGAGQRRLDAEGIVYQVVPRLNAICRLGDAQSAAELLMSRDGPAIQFLAAQAEHLNRDRQIRIQRAMEEARDLVRYECDRDDLVLVLSSQAFEPGLISLVASQVARQYGKPALVLRETEPGILAGSLRSSSRMPMARLLAQCQGYLLDWGGHMEAGAVRVRREDLDGLARALQEAARRFEILPAHEGEPPMRLPPHALTQEITRSLALLEPTGPGNSRPVFEAEGVEVTDIAPFGEGQAHARVRLRSGGMELTATGWWMARRARRLSRYLGGGGQVFCRVQYQAVPDESGRLRALTLRDLELTAVRREYTRSASIARHTRV